MFQHARRRFNIANQIIVKPVVGKPYHFASRGGQALPGLNSQPIYVAWSHGGPVSINTFHLHIAPVDVTNMVLLFLADKPLAPLRQFLAHVRNCGCIVLFQRHGGIRKHLNGRLLRNGASALAAAVCWYFSAAMCRRRFAATAIQSGVSLRRRLASSRWR